MRPLLAALVVASLACQRPLAAAEAPDPARALVQASELVGVELHDARVLDVRPVASFAAGHIPGAVRLDVKALRAEVDGVKEQRAPRAQIEATLREHGVTLGDTVIVVDDGTSPPAARVVWTLESFGHARGRVRLLDGGWPAWVAAGGATSVETSPVAAAEGPALGEDQPALQVDAAWVKAHLDDPSVLLLDVRSDEEWQAGRIPGAQHVPWEQARTDDGKLREPAALRELYARALASPTVAVYCKSGMRASVTWLVLRVLGHADVRVYDGSWNEWGARADLPKET